MVGFYEGARSRPPPEKRKGPKAKVLAGTLGKEESDWERKNQKHEQELPNQGKKAGRLLFGLLVPLGSSQAQAREGGGGGNGDIL